MLALRPLVALLLALVLAITSQAFAVARGQMAATGYIVICAGGGTVMMPVGPDGQPSGVAHLCPDAVLTLAELPSAAAAPHLVQSVTAVVVTRPGPLATVLATPHLPEARAPPPSV